MKITFLGTSHGYAEANRFQSSALVEVRGKSYIIDAGAPVEYQMATLGKDFDSIRGIFITHAHLDHIGGLPQLISPLLRYRYNDQCTCFISDAEVAEARKSQVGTGDRSERIRTYNYPQGRLTDHRIGLTLYRLEQILNGDLDEVIDSLVTVDQAEKLKKSEEN